MDNTVHHREIENDSDVLLTNYDKELKCKKLDDILSQIKFGHFQIRMMLVSCGCYFAVCSQMMLIVFLVQPAQTEWELSNLAFASIFVISSFGGMSGGFLCGILSDKYGRKIPFLSSLAILAVFGSFVPFANSFYLLVALRTVTCIGIGGLESLVYVLLLEFLPKRNRGSCLVAVTLWGTLGAVFASGMAWAFLRSYGWRYFVGACVVPTFIMIPVCLVFLSESPRYLYISGREEEAKNILQIMAKVNGEEIVIGEILCEQTKDRGKISDLFSRDHRVRTIVISGIWVLQCLGYWGVTLFLPKYMNSLGLDPYFSMFSVFSAELPGMVLAMILIEPHMFGRIKCLRFFAFFTSISLFLFAFVHHEALKAVCVVICFFFMVPLYSILNTITPEMYPTNIRATSLSFVNVLIEIPSMFTPFLSASLVSNPNVWLYPTVWAGVFMLQSLLTFFLCYETAGKSLNDSKEKNDHTQSTLL